MSKVALRVYNREIETLIDQGHIDEAVAHCQHILKIYPKHLETYRLLGKAHLEARRYADAADIFQRILLAVPDDFVSHLGTSIVLDEQKDLDGAIWHMERAFEINPSNGGVQGELRRLYGRRDGMEPPKIRLTRGALAQMYTKGGQYQQAITEIKSVLAEDDTRSDMKILMGRAYFRAGMKIEATEVCIDLLKQYPYSLDGNRILVEILPGTSMAQSVDLYKKRVEALDPYTAVVSGSIFETDGILDNAVTVERLDWDPNSKTENWGTTGAGQPAASSGTTGAEIPAWMQTSGWGPSTGEFQEGAASLDDSEIAPVAGAGLAAAEIPDWLKAMAPPGASSAQGESEESAVKEPAPADLDWLAGLGAPAGGNVSPSGTANAEGSPAASADMDWLNDLGATTGAAAASADGNMNWLNNPNPASEDIPSQPSPSGAEIMPDWLNEESPAQPETPVKQPVQPINEQPAPGEDAPDWLAAAGAAQTETQPQPSSGDTTPDWLGDLSTPQAEQVKTPAQPVEPAANWLNEPSDDIAGQPLSDLISGPGTSESEQDESLKWLEGLAEKQGAKAEELITNPTERTESAPDWLNKVEDTPVEQKAQAPAQYIPEKPIEVEAEPLVGELSPLISGPGTTESEQDDAFKWLENLAAGQGAKSEELLTKPEERAENAPNWVGEVENPPTELSSPISGPGTSETEQDDALKWLESLAEKQGAKAEELITNPMERKEDAPDWVAKVGQEPDQVISSVPPQPAPANQAAATISQQPAMQKPANQFPDDDGFVPGPLSELVSGPGTSESEQDESLKWLESLAAKQGAKSEELITNPDDRKESAPEWVAQSGQEPAASTSTPAETLSAPAQASPDDPLAWLQELAAGEPAPENQPLEKASTENPPVMQQPDSQDWMNNLGMAASSGATTGESTEEGGEGFNWLEDINKPAEGSTTPMPWEQAETSPGEQQASQPAAPEASAESPDWLANFGLDEVQKPPESVPSDRLQIPAAEPAAAEPQSTGDISEWLKNLETNDQPALESELQASVPPEIIPGAQDEIPTWLDSTATPAQPAANDSEELPDWLKDAAADEQPPAPEHVSEWVPTQEMASESPLTNTPPQTVEPIFGEDFSQEPATPAPAESIPAPVPGSVPTPPPPRPSIRETGILNDKDAPALQRARDSLGRGGLDTAIGEYAKLIKKGKLLEDVIYDLQEAVYSHPVDVVVWQTLGDAYMRSNRMQEALDAYSKAEELLR